MTEVKPSQSGGFALPWPLAGDGPLNNRCDEGDGTRRPRGSSVETEERVVEGMNGPAQPPNEGKIMSTEQCNAGRIEAPAPDRAARLAEARALMIAALTLLDQFSRSPACATLDHAIHHLDTELTR